MTCDQELWSGGVRCNKPAGHEGAHSWAKEGAAGLWLVCSCGTEPCPIHDPQPETTTTVGIPADVLLDETRLERS